jgi:hypothetical protein
MSKALELAKECGIRDNIHDDAAMDYISNARIETFYRRAQAQALRDAAEKFDYECDCGMPCDCYGPVSAKYQALLMADELETQK